MKWYDYAALVCVILVGAVQIGFFISYVPGEFSPDSAHWGQFGDYFGGVLNPLVALVAVYFIARTLAVTRAESRSLRKAAEQQLQHAQRDLKTNELRALMSDLLDRVEKCVTPGYGRAGYYISRLVDVTIEYDHCFSMPTQKQASEITKFYRDEARRYLNEHNFVRNQLETRARLLLINGIRQNPGRLIQSRSLGYVVPAGKSDQRFELFEFQAPTVINVSGDDSGKHYPYLEVAQEEVVETGEVGIYQARVSGTIYTISNA